jgi:hypothetical protein
MNACAPEKCGPVLIVEDEIVVALFLEDALAELGYQVAGVASRLDEAMARTKAPDFAAAVLDVHLNGEDVFPLADRLAELQLPFIFATGYGARGIPARQGDSCPPCRSPGTAKAFSPDRSGQAPDRCDFWAIFEIIFQNEVTFR